MTIKHSAAKVLAVYLIAEGTLSSPSTNKPWPVFTNAMPEKPPEVASIYNTDGFMDGREHRGGRSVIHPGFSIILRTADNDRADEKYGEISQKLDEINNTVVVISGKSYKLNAIKRTSPLLPIGEEEGGGRLKFSVSGTLTYGES